MRAKRTTLGIMNSEDSEDLKSAVLISRVMSGKSEYRTSDYLKAFGNLHMSDLHAPNDNVSYSEIIKLWNSQQVCPNKVRYVTFSIVNNNAYLQKRIVDLYSHAKYAWIEHDQDNSEHVHTHYVLLFPNPVSMRGIADDLELPLPMIEKVISKRGILDYLTHENQSEKHHYDLSLVQANFDINAEKKLDESIDVKQLFRHFCQVRNGEMTPDMFLDIYAVYCKNLAFPSLLQVCSRLLEGFGTGTGLSSRSEGGVPNPCKSSPFLFDFPPPLSKSPRKSSHKPNPRSDLNDIN